ncbi:hypothetical protein FA95DRAFT_1566279 [Auriscalpium vulgare]|uniref:Uncharacterized protein n=1 Tax=Auriscalpium vulgare TaxID=40419 RepID=A0ACB8RAD5_9AGAM|nr:hypothetical protein FA95DRAFT_1566279 [Auriscalpium vulgare]
MATSILDTSPNSGKASTAYPPTSSYHSQLPTPDASPVKLTGYRLLNITLTLVFAIGKAVLSLLGFSMMPTALEVVSVVVIANGLYILGFYESGRPPVWPWLFHEDYSRSLLRFLGHAARCVALFCLAFLIMFIIEFSVVYVALALDKNTSSATWHAVFSHIGIKIAIEAVAALLSMALLYTFYIMLKTGPGIRVWSFVCLSDDPPRSESVPGVLGLLCALGIIAYVFDLLLVQALDTYWLSVMSRHELSVLL